MTNNEQFLKACEDSDLILIERLLQEDVDVNVKSEYGATSLIDSIKYPEENAIDIVVALINAGADVNVKQYGSSALVLAAKKGEVHIVEILIDNGADISQKDERDLVLEAAFENLDVNLIRLLLKKGFKIPNEIALEGFAPRSFLSSFIDPGSLLNEYYTGFNARVGSLSPGLYEKVVNFLLDQGISIFPDFNGCSINEAIMRHIASSDNIV